MKANTGNRFSEEQKEILFREYYRNKLTNEEIGKLVRLNETAVSDFYRRAKKRGKITEVVNRKRRANRNKQIHIPRRKSPNKVHYSTHETNYDVDVRCTASIAKKCIYGAYGNSGYCNFMDCVGRARILTSPDHRHCHEFIKVDKDHKKALGRNAFNNE